jgi:hypothetical protein
MTDLDTVIEQLQNWKVATDKTIASVDQSFMTPGKVVKEELRRLRN